jgi:chromosome segregation ATPase
VSEIREMTELEVRLFTEMNKARAEAREKDAEIERLREDLKSANTEIERLTEAIYNTLSKKTTRAEYFIDLRPLIPDWERIAKKREGR